MRSYDDSFDPPAPVAFVRLIHPQTGAVAENVPMLVDSGADITVLPESAAGLLGVEVVDEVLTKVFDGSIVPTKVVEVDLKLGKGRFPGRYLLASCDVGLLGRDVLNELVVELHGPTLFWQLRRR